MSRLAAQIKMLYYPTQSRIQSMLKTYLAFPADGRKALCLDPCCGTGEALINICGEQFLYGIELNTQRGLEARNRQEFQQVLIGDFEASVVQNNAFGFLFLNPPYDYKSGGEKTARYEIIFLSIVVSNSCSISIFMDSSLFPKLFSVKAKKTL